MISVAIIAIFVWIGFVSAISFMEAWLKFRAPGVSLEIGLGIGKLVFKALHRVEVGLATLLLISFGFHYLEVTLLNWCLTIVLITILAIQSFLLLPKLSAAAQQRIDGISKIKSPFHIYFVLAEFTKVILLLFLGVQLLKY